MTGRERILAALKREQPDRVPTMEWELHPKVIEAVNGAKSTLEFVQKAGLSGIAVSLNYAKTAVDDRHFMDEWGVTLVSYDDYPNAVKHPIKNIEDFHNFTVPDPDDAHRFDSIKKALSEVGGEIAVVARVKDVFSHPRDLMGFEDFLMSFYLQPELTAELMAMCVEHSTRIAKNLVDIGIEVIVIGDDIANDTGLLLRPEMYMEQVYPYFKELVKNFKDLGLYVIKHSDGDLRGIADALIETGIDCLDPIDPLGHMEMAEMKAEYGDKIALKGNVDCISTLVDQPLEKVRQYTAKCILDGSIGGGHIISSSNSIHGGINPDNYRYFLECVEEFGQYPLDVALLEKISRGE